MTKDQIRVIFLANGFTVKDGETDLKPYVYAAAEALIAAEREACAMVCDEIAGDILNALVRKGASERDGKSAGASARVCAEELRAGAVAARTGEGA